MGLPTGKLVDAWPGHGPDRRTGGAQAALYRAAGRGVAASLTLLFLAFAAAAETLRVATWHVELERRGPGLLLRDILRGDDQVEAVVKILGELRPDVLLLTGIDWDLQGLAAAALAERVGGFEHRFVGVPNTGLMTDLDLNGDGELGGAADAQGYGRFRGHGAMALLSNVPILGVQDFTHALWADQPDALLPVAEGALFPSAETYEVQNLSSVAHWDVELEGGMHLLAFSATTPVFDGPEDRNGRRNHDEIMFWVRYLDRLDAPAVVLGKANLDPVDGEGLHAAITSLLHHPKLQDPEPSSSGGTAASAAQGGVNAQHLGDPALDTGDWTDEPGPGNLRVSYVLPDRAFRVLDSGVHWIEGEDTPSRHHMVWVDIDRLSVSALR